MAGRMPKLKRININSETELRIWLSKNAEKEESVILVTNTDKAHRKYVSREVISEMLREHDWKIKQTQTIASTPLRAHTIIKCGPAQPI